MKKFIIFIQIFCSFFAMSSYATENDKKNIIFGKFKNQLSVSCGQSIRGAGKEDLFYGNVTYSQPTSFFRRDARKNLELGFVKGSDNLSQYNLNFLGISGDVVLFSVGKLYTTVRLGAYVKSKTTNRISSSFTFGERLSLGYRLDSMNASLELYARHFSNGGLTDHNAGQNFYGITIGQNF